MSNNNNKHQSRALPVTQYLTLQDASHHTGVPYDTLTSAHNAGRLQIERIYTESSHVMWVHAGVLCDYMITAAPTKYRWTPKSVEIASLRRHSATQIRRKDQKEVAKLADQYRKGGTTPPIWTLSADGVEYVVDGYHRTQGRLDARQTEIDTIRVGLPFKYARAIAIHANQRHGRRIKDSDLHCLVNQHLAENPEDQAALEAGMLSMGELADLVVVSVSTVSRALMNRDKGPGIDPLTIFSDLSVRVASRRMLLRGGCCLSRDVTVGAPDRGNLWKRKSPRLPAQR